MGVSMWSYIYSDLFSALFISFVYKLQVRRVFLKGSCKCKTLLQVFLMSFSFVEYSIAFFFPKTSSPYHLFTISSPLATHTNEPEKGFRTLLLPLPERIATTFIARHIVLNNISVFLIQRLPDTELKNLYNPHKYQFYFIMMCLINVMCIQFLYIIQIFTKIQNFSE